MPEGDTVHKSARYLDVHLTGRCLDAVRIPPGPRSEGGERAVGSVTGARVTGVSARGKHLFVDLDNGLAIRTHLGLYGSWHHYAGGEAWRKPQRAASLVLDADGEEFVCFNAREVEVLRLAGLRSRTQAVERGPDLAVADPDLEAVVDRARMMFPPDAPVVDVLLDQRVAGGIGNVYKSEVLFLQGVHPAKPLQGIADPELHDLFACASRLIRRNLGPGPRITRFAEDRAGRLWVYRRRGRPCFRCGTPIRFAKLGRHLRSSYWCPGCQGER